MMTFSKVCDAADWFDADLAAVIDRELREPARFHRKQWEFGMIFLALKRQGVLRGNAHGLSMGGGRERLLYAVANHVEHITVTDLYSPDTDWLCARTDNPDLFVKSDPPIPTDVSRISALRADMRDLPFPSDSIDFCYSTCALEHIGGRDDFLRHFHEVYRVLRDDGIYVFTTEFHFGNETIEDPQNVIFSWEYLLDLFTHQRLVPEHLFGARMAHHAANTPYPGNIRTLGFESAGTVAASLLEELPHVQLLRGKHPFTAAIFVMKKRPGPAPAVIPLIEGRKEAAEFLGLGVERYRTLVSTHPAVMDPYAFLPGGLPPRVMDHQGFVENPRADALTQFHTDYCWWGKGPRMFHVELSDVPTDGLVEVRVHGYRTLASQEILCAAETRIGPDDHGAADLFLDADDDCCYAVVGKVRGKPFRPDRITIRSIRGGDGAPEIRRRMESSKEVL